MDYTGGATHIAKWQWDLIHDQGVIVRVFERDRDAEIIINNIDAKYFAKYDSILLNLRKFDVFEKVYTQVEKSSNYFVIQATPTSTKNLYLLEKTGGEFIQAQDKIYFGFIKSSAAGSEDNPHMILLNPPFKNKYGQVEHRGFSTGTIFEEIFHAGQFLTYRSDASSLLFEVEVRVAKAYLAYQIEKGYLSVNNYSVDKYLYDFLHKEEVRMYFENMCKKQTISDTIETEFRKIVKDMAKYVFQSYSKLVGWKPGQLLESYDGSTPYFDSLIK
jgi:hypothetical protein